MFVANEDKKTHHIPVIALTARAMKGEREEIRNVTKITSPTMHHSFKPFSPDLKSQKY